MSPFSSTETLMGQSVLQAPYQLLLQKWYEKNALVLPENVTVAAVISPKRLCWIWSYSHISDIHWRWHREINLSSASFSLYLLQPWQDSTIQTSCPVRPRSIYNSYDKKWLMFINCRSLMTVILKLSHW